MPSTFRSGVRAPNALQLVITIQVALAFLCLGTELFRVFVLHLHGVYAHPILIFPGDVLPDFSLWIGALFDHWHTSSFFQPGGHHFLYPAGAGLVYAFFHLFGRARLWLFAAHLLLIFLASTILFAHALTRRGLSRGKAFAASATLFAFSYPVWFSLQRGNIEIDVWALCALGIWALYRERPNTAAACFGFAAAIKLYPAIYLATLAAERKWKALLVAGLMFAVITFASLWLMYPHPMVSARETVRGLRLFDLMYVKHVNRLELGWDHSLWGLFKKTLQPSNAALARWSGRYTVLTAAAGLALWLTHLRKLPMANQILALTTAMIVFPPVSFDYTLLHLYTAFAFLLFATWRSSQNRSKLLLFALLSLATAPFSEVVLHSYVLEGQIKAILLLLLFLAALLLPVGADFGPGRYDPAMSESDAFQVGTPGRVASAL